VDVDGARVHLTAKEYQILELLRRGRRISESACCGEG
jgi:DNA-binding CsgD family transcriptional regulator